MKKTIAGFGSVILAGCANMPLDQTPSRAAIESPAQAHLQAPANWSVVAADAAAQIISQARARRISAIAWQANTNESTFDALYRDKVEADLLQAGIRLNSSGTPLLTKKRIVLRRSPKESATPLPINNTLLAVGVAVVRDLIISRELSAALIAAGATVDTITAINHAQTGNTEPSAEIAITHTLGPADDPAWKRTDVYYVTTKDLGLYRSGTTTTLPIKGH